MRVAYTLLATTAAFIFATASIAAETLPFTAYVNREATPVRCTASSEHPAVSSLEAGTAVEVWRREPGGWLAIRPNAGSFSWVSAKHVVLLSEPNLIQVNSPDAVSWIGTTNSQQRLCWHVQLKPGEKLKLLSNRPVVDTSTGEAWLKIEPPAGEFRWVHSRFIDTTPPGRTVVASADSTTSSTTTVANKTAELQDAASSEQTPAVSTGWKTRGADQLTSAMACKSPEQQSTTPTSINRANNAAAHPNTTQQVDENTFQQQLDTVTVDLAAMVAQPPGSWNLDPVIQQLKQMTITGPTPLLRGKAQLMWERATQFQQVQQGYQQQTTQLATSPSVAPSAAATAPQLTSLASYQPPHQTVYPPSQPATFSPSPIVTAPPTFVLQQPQMGPLRSAAQRLGQAIANGPSGGGFSTQTAMVSTPTTSPAVAAPVSPINVQSTQAGIDPRYDGVGWLMPLVARSQLQLDGRSAVPPFALTDEEGNVLSLVTPSPGVNLRRYVRQKVGIFGQTGQLPDVLTPHLTAQRVVVLQRHE